MGGRRTSLHNQYGLTDVDIQTRTDVASESEWFASINGHRYTDTGAQTRTGVVWLWDTVPTFSREAVELFGKEHNKPENYANPQSVYIILSEIIRLLITNTMLYPQGWCTKVQEIYSMALVRGHIRNITSSLTPVCTQKCDIKSPQTHFINMYFILISHRNIQMQVKTTKLFVNLFILVKLFELKNATRSVSFKSQHGYPVKPTEKCRPNSNLAPWTCGVEYWGGGVESVQKLNT